MVVKILHFAKLEFASAANQPGGQDFWCYGMTNKSFELQPGGQIVITLCSLPVRFHSNQCPQKYQAKRCYLLTNPCHGVKRILEPGVCIGTLVKEAQFDVASIDYEKICCFLPYQTKKEHFFYILSLCLVYYVVSICLYYFVCYVLPWLIFLYLIYNWLF
jgi:hypothetical protein